MRLETGFPADDDGAPVGAAFDDEEAGDALDPLPLVADEAEPDWELTTEADPDLEADADDWVMTEEPSGAMDAVPFWSWLARLMMLGSGRSIRSRSSV